ncbi:MULTISPECIES: ricin-type beta-trefoil lectin domain protein [Kitasatospora]|uniref:Ricin-type beta-trefoil lectin domain protein n=1 Tax=Kitasatospora cathayae TaxID=3004092 RepID=A0ABY7QDT3_9ACTN|nr:ricin-type beta-trefoil lectin domain protein [Kitasatospora sp. HUAS 3-15]WBP90544.1 ricin-type beta-trefoil lectin domain protein [Kitasatospora sp. HUAS 3-15]
MAFALRKTLAVAALALTASFLPAGGAGAADTDHSAPRTPGLYCLANAWNTPNIGTKPCNSSDPGQHWTLAGEQISLSNARGYCLANTWNTQSVSVKPCNPNDPGQYWTVSGEQISLTFAPAYCLANAWDSPAVGTQPCNIADPGQHWVVFNDQISLALA